MFVCVCACVCAQERNAAAKGKLAAMISQQPMFCFETAVKLFFFSSFVYSGYNGVRQWQCGDVFGSGTNCVAHSCVGHRWATID